MPVLPRRPARAAGRRALGELSRGIELTSKRVRVQLGRRSYDVRIGSAGVEATARFLAALDRDLCVVTDSHLARQWWPRVGRALRRRSARAVHRIVIPAGERTKTLATVQRIQREMLRHAADRATCVVAFGGGVVGDVAGFAAATYMRGVDWVVVPTSLLAMVDAAVGGKTGVNLAQTKNVVGAFHQPLAVWIDTTFLRTLPGRERASGLGEVVKYAMIADARLFATLERGGRAWRRPRAREDAQLIARCCTIKAAFVAADERETGRRAALNFGHTIGHALEGDGRTGLRHGEAVGLGMLAACSIASRTGLAPAAVGARLARLLDDLGLPTRTAPVQAAGVRRAWRRDKKARAGRPRFVLTGAIGRVSVGHEVPDAVIVEALRGILVSRHESAPPAEPRFRRRTR